MGVYTDSLFKKGRSKLAGRVSKSQPVETKKPLVYLTCVAIMQGESKLIYREGIRSHYELRQYAGGYNDPMQKKPKDVDGFMTNQGHFVTRAEAMDIGAVAGQCQRMGRELLSSDIDWNVG